MQMLNDWAANWGVMQWVALIVVSAIVGYVLAELYLLFRPSEDESQYKKFVVIVRQARPGEFGGYVSMQSIKRTDEWRVTWAETAADAVNEVLGAGEVPVLWKSWESLSWWRKSVLNVREVWHFVRGA